MFQQIVQVVLHTPKSQGRSPSIVMSNPVTIRFSDNSTGKGQNVQVTPDNNNILTLSDLLKKTDLAQVGYITSIELQSDFTNIETTVWVSSTEVAVLTTNKNSISLPTRSAISQVTLRVKRLA